MGIEGTLFRDAVNDDLIALLAIQKDAFARYTNRLLPEQIPPLNETLEDSKEGYEVQIHHRRIRQWRPRRFC